MRAVPLLLLLAPAGLAAAPRLPADAPDCASPQARPLFVSAMGEPFRAARGQPYPVQQWFAGADRNRDGRVDRGEFLADADRFFRTLDLDHDGRVSPEEVVAYERDVAPEIALYAPRSSGQPRAAARRPAAPRLRAGESGYGGPLGAGRYAWLNVPEPVAAADADLNREVDRAEFLAAAGRRFDTLGGGDGLALAALPRTPQQAAIEGPCRPLRKPRRADRDRDDDARDRPAGEPAW